MPRPRVTWATTDWHLNHRAIVEACGRPEDYGRRILARHVELIRPGDTLVNLGDVNFYGGPDSLREFLARIPCTHILVLGNHDRKSRSWYRDQGFAFACDALVLDGVLLTHKPTLPLPAGVRLNVHGHWHNKVERAREADGYDPARQRLLALEHTDYAPVNLRDFARERD